MIMGNVGNNFSEEIQIGGGWQQMPKRKTTAKVFIPTVLAFAISTGSGLLTAEEICKQSIGYTVPNCVERGGAAIRLETTIEKINKIRDVMQPSMTELAGVFGVQRQAIYKWLNGDAISSENQKKLNDLACAADLLIEAGIQGKQIFSRQITDGKNLFELAKDGSSATEIASRLISILEDESKQRERIAARFAGRGQITPIEADDFV